MNELENVFEQAELARRALRDEFAKAALIGLCSHTPALINFPDVRIDIREDLARIAFALADAMMAERKKGWKQVTG